MKRRLLARWTGARGERGPRGRGWAILVALLVVVGGSGAWLLVRDDSSATSAPLTVRASSGTVKQTVSASGTIEPARTADLDFAVSGTVTAVYVKAGDTVTKGQAIAKVGDGTLVAARTAAQASYDAAVTQHSTDVAAGASDVQLAADETAVLAARSQLTSATRDVRDAVLRSTIAGTVEAIDLHVGDVVGASSGSGTGGTAAAAGTSSGTGSGTSTSAVTIASSKRYVVDATVSADDAARVKKGMQAQVSATGASTTLYGTVASVGLVAQTSSAGAAVFPVVIALTGALEDVYAGTTATASITVKQTANVLTVASRAIRSSGSSTYVLKVVDGKAVKTPVTTGTVYGATTEITSGLSAGDTVQVPGITLPSGSGGTGSGTSRGGFPSGGQLPSGGFAGGGLSGGGAFPGGAQ